MTKTCPRCGASVDESALSCPRCHAALDVTQRMSLSDAVWCPSCGALVAPGSRTCPKCGASLASPSPSRARRDLDLPEIGATGELFGLGAEDSERTGVMTRIESAIPPADGASSPAAPEDRMPKTRSLLLAALLAVLVVGGAALLITHPWDPSATQTRATTPADTSLSGFPGEVKELTGQDSSQGGDAQDGEGSATPEEELASAYATLGDLSGRVDESEQALRAACEDVSGADFAAGLEEAQAVSIEVSNLISQVELVSGADEGDVENLLTLGNWLRNRCDALTAAWELGSSASDASSEVSSMLSGVDTSAEYGRLFDQSYDGWDPAA